MTEKTEYQCPLEGCEYSAATVGSVKGHITKSQGVHAGKSGPDFGPDIERVAVSGDSGGSQQSGGSGGGLGIPEPPGGSSGSQGGEEPTCPECGGSKWFDASEHTDYKYGCASCSNRQNWVVWG